MGIPVLILGESGSGKSASIRTFEDEEVGIFNVAGKPLPFKKKFSKSINLPLETEEAYKIIFTTLKAAKLKRYVIDDSQYLLAFDFFNSAKDKGYEKFTNMALRFFQLVQMVINKVPDDVCVYFLHHTETSQTGHVKAKTIGKMLDEKLTVEGMFSIVLMADTDGVDHKFITQSDGFTTAKSPMEMFEREIDNDLKFVDDTIRKYYEL